MADSAAPPMIGLDLVDTGRLRERIERDGDLARELFREGELSYCQEQASPYEHLAARFGAKEAVIKALGIDGWDPLDVEVVGGGDEAELLLHGAVAERAASLGVSVTVSLTHLPGIAGAVALARPLGP